MSKWSEYLAHGWKLCAIPAGTKGPRTDDWQLKDAPFNENAMNAGLCHAWSGTCAVDFDDLKRALAGLDKDGVDLDLNALENVHLISGRPNRDKLLFTIAEPLPSISLYPYEVPDPERPGKTKKYHALELRCGDRKGNSVQDVLPPSIHPGTGKPYQWAYGDDLTGTWANLPPLPAALEALWRAKVPPASAATAPVAAPQGAGAELPELQAFLETHDPNCEHDEWVEVGMILHHETRGSAAGLALYDTWSRKGSKYGESKDGKPAQFPVDKWRSFKLDAPNPKTIGEFRREQVAAVTDFPLVPAAAAGKVADDGLASLMPTTPQELGQVVAYVCDQGKFVDMRKNMIFKNVEAVATTFGPFMKLTKKGAKPNLEGYLKSMRLAGNNADHMGMHPGIGASTPKGKRAISTCSSRTMSHLSGRHPRRAWPLSSCGAASSIRNSRAGSNSSTPTP